MKKILLISNYFFPCTLTPSQRITFWANNFYRLGYYPTVVTREWSPETRSHHDTKQPLGNQVRHEVFDSHEVYYLPFHPGILDRVYLAFGESTLRPLFLLVKPLDVLLARFTLRHTSYANFLPFLKELLGKKDFNSAIISGEPFYLFRLGYSLRNSFGLKWVADYRDDWTTNELQMEKSGGAIRRMIAKLESNYEKKWVGTADSIISVSERYTERITNFLGKQGVTVQNGFEESITDLAPLELESEFTVIYSGVLYPSQDLRLIIEVLNRCHKEGRPFRLVFLGAGFDLKEKIRIESLVPEHLNPWVEVTVRFPRMEAIQKLRKAHVLLGIAYGQMKGIPSSKLYEYLALGKPVLLCPSDGDVMESMVMDAGVGFVSNDPNEGELQINRLQALYKSPELVQEMKRKSQKNIGRFSRFEQMKKLLPILED